MLASKDSYVHIFDMEVTLFEVRHGGFGPPVSSD